VKRASLKVVALAATLVIGIVAAPPTSAAAPPGPAAGGPAALLRYVGDPSSATGNALSNGECDVNGDDYDDVVTGAWFWDKTPGDGIGATYVIFGGPEVDGAALADPAEAGAVRIDGPAIEGASTAFAVGCLGDINGDDIDDIAISHYIDQKVYVIFGAEDFTGLTLDAIGDRGFTVRGGEDSGNVGFSLAAVGDLNADGLDDFGIAEVAADTRGRDANGRVWVLAGRDDITDVDLLAPAEGDLIMTVDGALDGERIGNIARVGDVDGDGIDDFLLGSYVSTPWGTTAPAAGAAYVVFGGTTGAVDAGALGEDGFTIVGPNRARDRLGISVSALGDINADGKADLLIGADGVTNAATGPRTGGAAVVFGSASTAPVYTDPLATPGQSVFTCADAGPIVDARTCVDETRRGYWLNGAVASDNTGYSLAGLGDVNGDALPDLAIGAYNYDPVNPAGGTFAGAGATYVVYGDPTATVVELGALPAEDGYRLDGTLNGDRFGRQVARIGDLDGNGVDDIAIGADFAKRPDAATGNQNGEITIALMGRLATTVVVTGPASAPVQDEVTFTAAVAQPAAGGAVVATGTVAFGVDGAVIAGCEAVAVVAGSASCTTTFTVGVAGPVTAAFSGTDLLQTGTGELPFTVAPPRTADESWVLAAYEDFLDRAPTEPERAATVARLGAGTTRATIARELSTTAEWIEVSIRRFYLDTLDREPDAAGLAFWIGEVQSKRRPLAAVAASFYSSPEYYANAGGTDADWVADLYEKVLHRPAQPGDIVFWVDRTRAQGRGKVAATIYGSLESRRDRVTLLYDALLDRAPETGGLAYWADRIATTGDLALAVNLVVSPEYVDRAQVRFP